MPVTNVNILAVLVAAVLSIVVGAVWYSPALFAKQWMAAQGYTPEMVEHFRQKRMVRAYAVSFACYFVMAYVLSLFATYTGATTFVQGLWLGFLVWLGFAAPIGLTGNMFSGKPFAAWVIDAGYQLTYLLIIGVLLTLWR